MSKLYKYFPSFFSVLFGLVISWVFSHPASPAKRKLPEKSARNVYFFPNLKIHRKTHYYHFHHWMYFGAAYLFFFIFRRGFKGRRVVEGFLLGIIFQGLSYSDRFKIKFTPGASY